MPSETFQGVLFLSEGTNYVWRCFQESSKAKKSENIMVRRPLYISVAWGGISSTFECMNGQNQLILQYSFMKFLGVDSQ